MCLDPSWSSMSTPDSTMIHWCFLYITNTIALIEFPPWIVTCWSLTSSGSLSLLFYVSPYMKPISLKIYSALRSLIPIFFIWCWSNVFTANSQIHPHPYTHTLLQPWKIDVKGQPPPICYFFFEPNTYPRWYILLQFLLVPQVKIICYQLFFSWGFTFK